MVCGHTNTSRFSGLALSAGLNEKYPQFAVLVTSRFPTHSGSSSDPILQCSSTSSAYDRTVFYQIYVPRNLRHWLAQIRKRSKG